jgi:hypothetical protein
VANTSAEVDQFMARLEHPLKEGVQRLRTAILASNDTITEHIKWNAPSFHHAGQDRVTFRLQPGDKLQLIFYRGAKVRTVPAEQWVTASAGMVRAEQPLASLKTCSSRLRALPRSPSRTAQ